MIRMGLSNPKACGSINQKLWKVEKDQVVEQCLQTLIEKEQAEEEN